VPDLPKEVPDLKLEVPDRRSGGIRPNLSTASCIPNYSGLALTVSGI